MAFFLTALDPRAAIKGSRDPLGAQAVWAALGREVVGNLTTVTDSVRGFTTLLVGLRLAERAAEAGRERSVASAFLVWEQLAGYARCCFHGETSLLGSRKVVARTRRGHATLSASSEHQILANQKSYGLWGLYTSAARSSGLVDAGTPPRLTAAGRDQVDHVDLRALVPRWGRDAGRLVDLLATDGTPVDIRAGNKRLRAIAEMLDPQLRPDEVAFYRRHLVKGGPADRTGGRQARLAQTMEEIGTDRVPALVEAADDDVAYRLRRIASAESVLAPAAVMFSHLLSQENRSLDEVGRDLAGRWGARLDSVAEDAPAVLQGEWAAIAQHLAAGDYVATLRLLLERNRNVMSERGGSGPWATVSDSGTLAVRLRDEPGGLPGPDEARTLWRNPYFLPSLQSVAHTVGRAA